MKKLLLLLFILLNATFSANAQQDSISMDGTLTLTKSDTYKYKLVVGLAEGKWKGYSVLDDEGANETRSSVSIVFSKEKESLIFSEKILLSSKSKETSFCSIGGVLKMNEKKNQIKGFFLGQDEKKKMCASGTIKFDLPEAAKKLMTPDGTRDTNAASIITKFRSESFKVTNTQIKLELWDGGINDHDSISVSLNNELIIPVFEILNDKKIINLNLKKGENILKIKALNEGTEPPNSARINIIDQNTKYPIVSFLKKNEEAIVKIKL